MKKKLKYIFLSFVYIITFLLLSFNCSFSKERIIELNSNENKDVQVKYKSKDKKIFPVLFTNPPGVILGVIFSKTNEIIISYGLSGSISIYNLKGVLIDVINISTHAINSLDLSNNEKYLLIALSDGSLFIYDFENRQYSGKIKIDKNITKVAFFKNSSNKNNNYYIVVSFIEKSSKVGLSTYFLEKENKDYIFKKIYTEYSFDKPIIDIKDMIWTTIGDRHAHRFFAEQVGGKLDMIYHNLFGEVSHTSNNVNPYYQTGFLDGKMGKAISSDQNTLALGGSIFDDSNEIDIYDISDKKKMKLKSSLREGRVAKTSISFSPENNLLAAGDRYGRLFLWDTKKYKLLNNPDVFLKSSGVNSFSISPNNRYFAIGLGPTSQFNSINKNLVIIYDHESSKFFTIERNFSNDKLIFSKDSKLLYALTNRTKSDEADISNNNMGDFFSCTDKNTFIFCSDLQSKKSIIDLSLMKVIKNIDRNILTDNIKKIINGQYGVKFYWGNNINEVYNFKFKRFNISFSSLSNFIDIKKDNDKIGKFYFFDGGFVIINNDGYFDYYGDVLNFIAFSKRKNIIPLTSLYSYFYNPKKAVEDLYSENKVKNDFFNIEEALKEPPPNIKSSISIVNNHSLIDFEVTPKLSGGVGDVIIFHNGKLEYLESFKKTSKNKYNGKFKSNLSDGVNEYSIIVFNKSNTIHSIIKTHTVNNKSKNTNKPVLYIVSIGINNFTFNKDLSLEYALNDSISIAKSFEKKWKGESVIKIFTDNSANKKNILRYIKNISNKINVNDVFILFFASHGVIIEKNVAFATSDFKKNNSKDSSIIYSDILNITKKIQSLNQMYIFDICFSGSINSNISNIYNSKITKLSKNIGISVLSSSSPREVSLEGFKGNGYFTYSILDAMKDSSVKTSLDLSEKTKIIFSNIVNETINQTPVYTNIGSGFSLLGNK